MGGLDGFSSLPRGRQLVEMCLACVVVGIINFYGDSTSSLPSPGARREQNQRHSQNNVYSRMPRKCNTVESRSFSRFGRRRNSSAAVSAFARGGTLHVIHVHNHSRQRLHPFVAILSKRHPRGLRNRIGSLFALHIRPHGVHTHSVLFSQQGQNALPFPRRIYH